MLPVTDATLSGVVLGQHAWRVFSEFISIVSFADYQARLVCLPYLFHEIPQTQLSHVTPVIQSVSMLGVSFGYFYRHFGSYALWLSIYGGVVGGEGVGPIHPCYCPGCIGCLSRYC